MERLRWRAVTIEAVPIEGRAEGRMNTSVARPSIAAPSTVP